MIKRTEKIIEIVEIIIYTLIFLAIADNTIKIPIETNSNIAFIILLVNGIAFIISTITSFKYPKALDHIRAVAGYAILALLAYKNIDMLIPKTEYKLGFMVFMLFVFTFSSRGNLKYWGYSILLFISGYALANNSLNVDNFYKDADLILMIGFSLFLFLISNSKISGVERKLESEKKEEIIKSRQATQKELTEIYEKEKKEKQLKNQVQAKASFLESVTKELESVVLYFIDRIYHPHTVAIFLYDSDKMEFVLNKGKSKSTVFDNKAIIPRGDGIVGEIADTLRSYSGGRNALHTKDLGYYRSSETIESVVVVPILDKDGILLGAIAIDDMERNRYQQNHIDAMTRFAKVAAALITNIRLRIHEEEQAKRFKLLYESSQTFADSNDTIKILDSLLDNISGMENITRVTVVAYMKKSTQCKIIRVNSLTTEIADGYSFNSRNTLITDSLNTKEVINVLNYDKDRKPIYVSGENLNKDIKSLLITPFHSTGAEYEIAIVVESNVYDNFNKEIEDMIKTIVNNGTAPYEKSILYKRMEQMATTDGLTKLPNHRTFQEYLKDSIERSERYGRKLSMLLMDIDKFKVFNDTYGHQIGDIVLKHIAKALTASVRNTDLAARYGGEEFVVVLPETDVEESLMMAERIRHNIESTKIETDKGILSVTVSIGSSTLNLHGADSQEILIAQSDIAMYHSKEGGRNMVKQYISEMGTELPS